MRCPDCNGKGIDLQSKAPRGYEGDCKTCEGSGKVPDEPRDFRKEWDVTGGNEMPMKVIESQCKCGLINHIMVFDPWELLDEIDRLRSDLKVIQEHSATTLYLGKLDRLEKENEALRSEREEMLENLKDVVNQACLVKGDSRTDWRNETRWDFLPTDYHLDTGALSAYEDALAYLVKIGEAEWIREGATARWKEGSS